MSKISILKNKMLKAPILAISALLLSCITAYYQFFWSEQSLQVSILKLTINQENKTLHLKTALINSGSEPILIKGYRLGAKPKKHNGLVYVGSWKEEPFVIKKGEIIVKEDVTQLSESEVVRLNNKSCLPHHLALNIETLTNDGSSFFNQTHIATIRHDEKNSFIRYYPNLVDVLNDNNEFRKNLSDHERFGESLFSKVINEPIEDCELY